ncbi:chromosome segregation ATPase [Anoxybacillus voinovskiensis]|uniref:Chromosome segregation ATPase n=1 Tax=Anoxybacteroides voinovskiense TaxID=230470 RepID=A0A840DS98_9BACL|nr:MULTISPECIES: hypothetical protein [Anoxybacillus]MBB4074485.1 chromosome segregation ATPase [Anoxybacillus voinovskiensis]MCL6586181.1 hypothetical protein [Anoxybacillus sp.]GGJ79252.1 hypothetical protein GCM10008982_30760 [Anoxybacillus voinovskiensis]
MEKITNEMIWQAVKELANQLRRHSEETNRRFAQIDQRFEQIDEQFAQINQRFEQIDEQFAQTKQQLAEVKEQLDEFGQNIVQMDKQLTDVANGQKILVEELFDNKKELKRVKTVLNMY